MPRRRRGGSGGGAGALGLKDPGGGDCSWLENVSWMEGWEWTGQAWLQGRGTAQGRFTREAHPAWRRQLLLEPLSAGCMEPRDSPGPGECISGHRVDTSSWQQGPRWAHGPGPSPVPRSRS